MKKKYFIFTTLFALVITLGLFTASVIAAVRVNFGISNTITFIGANKNMAFEIDAKIYGTTLKGQNMPTYHYSYDYNTSQPSTDDTTWNVGNIEFDAQDINNIKISFEFVITNTGNSGDYDIKAYIVPVYIQTEDLNEPIIVGTASNPVQIATNSTKDSQGTISLEITPTTKTGFEGSRTCNFNVVVEPIEN